MGAGPAGQDLLTGGRGGCLGTWWGRARAGARDMGGPRTFLEGTFTSSSSSSPITWCWAGAGVGG